MYLKSKVILFQVIPALLRFIFDDFQWPYLTDDKKHGVILRSQKIIF